MKKWLKGTIFGAIFAVLLCAVLLITHEGGLDDVSSTTHVQTAQLKPVPKPTFKVERVQPEANGTYQIGFLDHGPVKVNDMWTKDFKPNANQTLWNEVTVYSGVLRDNPDQGVINEWVVNAGESHHWNVPGSAGGSVTIESIQGDVIHYKTANGKGILNVATGKFN